jgi:hypothetical protein
MVYNNTITTYWIIIEAKELTFVKLASSMVNSYRGMLAQAVSF